MTEIVGGSERSGLSTDRGIAISTHGILVAVLLVPMLLIAALATLVGLLLTLGPEVPLFFRVAGLVLSGLGGVLTCTVWVVLLHPKRLQMRVYRDKIELLRKGAVIKVIRRKAIGCLVRWDTRMFVFDTDDRLAGEWDLGWVAGGRSEMRFKRAMEQYDYPSRIFFVRVRPSPPAGSGRSSLYSEWARTGAMARELGALSFSERWMPTGDGTIQPGPGLSAGPMAEYLGSLPVGDPERHDRV